MPCRFCKKYKNAAFGRQVGLASAVRQARRALAKLGRGPSLQILYGKRPRRIFPTLPARYRHACPGCARVGRSHAAARSGCRGSAWPPCLATNSTRPCGSARCTILCLARKIGSASPRLVWTGVPSRRKSRARFSTSGKNPDGRHGALVTDCAGRVSRRGSGPTRFCKSGREAGRAPAARTGLAVRF